MCYRGEWNISKCGLHKFLLAQTMVLGNHQAILKPESAFLIHVKIAVTPTFYKHNFFCANRGAYKNAYQIIVHMKNFPKINLV
jgi:hypothetical protein